MRTDERVVVLMGAGSVIDGTGVNTQALTNRVIEATNDCGNLVRTICTEFRNIYGTGNPGACRDINFEDIYNIVELLEGYRQNWPLAGYAPQERVFAQLRPAFESITDSEIFSVQNAIISVINDEIYRYDAAGLNSARGLYFREFFARLDQTLPCKLDVFNLNYDTWVEQSLLSYSDGFVVMPEQQDIMRFNIEEYLKTKKHRVSHLHGQIYFGFPPISINVGRERNLNYEEPFDTLYKYKDYIKAKKIRETTVHSRDNNQNGNPIYKTNIITGMLKLDKLLRHPLDLYFGELIHSLTTYNKLIVIGYGFFDLYINQLLFLFNSAHLNDRKIVLIDYISHNLLEDVIEHPFHTAQDKSAFSNLMFQDDYWWDRRRQTLRNEQFHYSDDRNAMLCVNGAEWASDNVDEIIDFLRD